MDEDLWDDLRNAEEGKSLRIIALRLAFDLLKGSDSGTDYQSVVRAARTFEAYIEEG